MQHRGVDIDTLEVAARAGELDGKSPQDILAFALEHYAPRVAISTAFGAEGCALIDMAVRIDPKVQVFTVDTGYLFRETQQLKERLVAKYDLNLTVFEPELSVPRQDKKFGLRLYESDSDRCCQMRKVEPTGRALAGLDAWIAGLRRDQSRTRASISPLDVMERADGSKLVKVHPLYAWTRKDTWRYVMDNGVPYNELLDQGYTSVGCWPCTRAVRDGEDERAGRWNGSKSECGIHTFMGRATG